MFAKRMAPSPDICALSEFSPKAHPFIGTTPALSEAAHGVTELLLRGNSITTAQRLFQLHRVEGFGQTDLRARMTAHWSGWTTGEDARALCNSVCASPTHEVRAYAFVSMSPLFFKVPRGSDRFDVGGRRRLARTISSSMHPQFTQRVAGLTRHTSSLRSSKVTRTSSPLQR